MSNYLYKMNKIFVDSSVLFAGIASRTGFAHDLLGEGQSHLHVVCSSIVLEEVERNLRRKFPIALPDFATLRGTSILHVVDPPDALIIECEQVVHTKDAPVLAAAIHSQATWIATYDQRHLLSKRDEILARYTITTARPDEILESLGLAKLR